MFNKILVCLDGSQLAEQIMPYVLKEALAFKSKVILLRVLSLPYVMTPEIPGSPGVPVLSSSAADKLAKHEDAAKDYLEHIAQPLRKNGLRVDCVTLEGLPGSTIAEYANKNKVDLIAIATHGHSGLRHALVGSVAEFVIREVDVPILMIRPKHPEK